MTTEIIFNMNDMVCVTLTGFGAAIMNERYSRFKQYGVEREFIEGQDYRTQLWSLMQDFGQHIHLGMSQVPFKDNVIKLEKP